MLKKIPLFSYASGAEGEGRTGAEYWETQNFRRDTKESSECKKGSVCPNCLEADLLSVLVQLCLF